MHILDTDQASVADTATLVSLMQSRAHEQPDKLAYTFLLDGEKEAKQWTYSQLAQNAQIIAARLQTMTQPGDRVLLLQPPGLDYITAFFGCLYAGVIAVPAYPPRVNNRPMPRLQAIVADAQAKLALTNGRILESIERRFDRAPDLAALHWLATDDPVWREEELVWRETAVSPDDIAFFQYTSGSTAAPKGVMLTHRNLLHNLKMIRHFFRADESDRAVIWLPPYHDMGLIGGILEPLYLGIPVTLMSPVAFLQKPVRWLQAITRTRATQSGGPNFAYDLCVDKITPEQKEGLDLNSWKVAFNGAEPVRAETIERFTTAFADCGFQPEAFYPCYGMAEATLLISGSVPALPPRFYAVDRAKLTHHQVAPINPDAEEAQILVSSGRFDGEQVLRIVDPQTEQVLPDGEIGEIWVSSASVTQGYWNKPEATARNLRSRLSDYGDRRFLRTGDLGFIHDDELFITGRIKDLIIIRGRNHYPQDIEQIVADSHVAFARDGGAAFSVDMDGQERLVLVQEVERAHRKTAVSELAQAARKAVAAHHGLELYALVLLSPLRIPRTSSGKIKRHACRHGYINGTLEPMAVWTADQPPEMPEPQPAKKGKSQSDGQESPTPPSGAAIRDWMMVRLAKQLDIPPEKIDVHQPLAGYGLDSLAAINLSGELGAWLEQDLPGNLLLEHDTIAALAAHLAGETIEAEKGVGKPEPNGGAPGPVPTSAAAEMGVDRETAVHPYTAYVNPYLGRVLTQFKMDKRFVRAEGCYLWDEDGNRYLDFIAMYGALPFGYNPPEIWAVVQEAQQAMWPSFAQPSMLDAAGELAQRLIELAPPGLQYVTFANSGAEAVEAAVKLARAATGKQGILSTDNGFHGKTLGALSATGRNYYQRPFGAPVADFSRIPFGDLKALEAALDAQAEELAAFIVEPIQGEGGIVEPPPGYLAGVRELCTRYGVLLIADEIQTGLGRTGHLFVCEAERVQPDVLLLAKALGGGLMPIGAVLSRAECYVEEFAIKHTSTFAANTLACRVGLQTLTLLTRDDQALLWQVAANGAYLKAGLEKLQRQYSHILTAVRGRGYMLGLKFSADRHAYGRQCLLGPLAEQEMLTAVIASYMLNAERIRVAPTLNGNSVLRLEPPLTADRAMADQVIGAVERLLAILAAGNTAQLMAHLVDRGGIPAPEATAVGKRREKVTPQPGDGRFAFLVHPLTPRSYVDFDASLAAFSDDELADLTARWKGAVEPFVVGATRIESPAGAAAYGEFIGIPHTADELMSMPQAEATAVLRQGVDLARARGARIVGLGSYTSIASRNGLALQDAGVPITTGNSFTVVATVAALAEAAAQRELDLAQATVAVIGATGSIGRATALLLAEKVGRLILIGNPTHPEQSLARLQTVADDVVRHLAQNGTADRAQPDTIAGVAIAEQGASTATNGAGLAQLEAALVENGRLLLTTDADRHLPGADIVVTATSSTQGLLRPDNLKQGAIVCDTSQPSNVSETVMAQRPDVNVIEGGVIAAPGQPDLGWEFGLERGVAFACMAETMMLALEQHDRHGSLGLDLDPQFMRRVDKLAQKHGFALARVRE